MDDIDLTAQLTTFHTEGFRHPDPPGLRDSVMDIPATTSRRAFLPPLTWRFQSMFSATKLVVAGVIVALFGGFLLIAQPFDQQEASVPGAEAPFAAPVEVTGLFITNDGEDDEPDPPEVGDYETLPGVSRVWTDSGTVSASDHRLEGTLADSGHSLLFMGNGLETSEILIAACQIDIDCGPPTDGPYLWIASRAQSIENDEGAWRQRPSVEAVLPGGWGYLATALPWVDVFVGEGAYDGLIAVLEFSAEDPAVPNGGCPDASEAQSCSWPFHGVIVDARQLPPVPDNASTK